MRYSRFISQFFKPLIIKAIVRRINPPNLKCRKCKRRSIHRRLIEENGVVFCEFCGADYNVVRTLLGRLSLRRCKHWEDESIIEREDWCRKMIPEIDRDELNFEIRLHHELHHVLPDYRFDEYERYLKVLYIQAGYFPQVGDLVEAESYRIPNQGRQELSYPDYKDFVIISRQFGVDDYSTLSLFVVPECAYRLPWDRTVNLRSIVPKKANSIETIDQ